MKLAQLAKDLLKRLPATTREKGRELVREDRVVIVANEPDSLRALVWGTIEYGVSIRRGVRDVEVHCECVAFWRSGPCKHLWATLLAASETTESGATVARPPLDEDSIRARQAARQLPWQERLRDVSGDQRRRRERARKRVLGTGDEVLLYDLQLHSTYPEAPLLVGLRRVRRRKRVDAYTKGHRVELRALDLDQLTDRLDRRLVGRLARCALVDDGYGPIAPRGGVRIPAADASEVARLLARTGRCFLKRALDEKDSVCVLREDPGEPWRVTFSRRTLDAARLLEVNASLSRGSPPDEETRALDGIACWLPPGHFVSDGALHEVEDRRAAEWVADLIGYGPLYVPLADLDRFERTLLSAPGVPAGLPLGDRVVTGVSPVPVLRISGSGAGRATATGTVSATLVFEYDGTRTEDDDDAGALWRGAATVDGEDEILLRDHDAELRHAQRLFSMRSVAPTGKDRPGQCKIQSTGVADVVLRLLADAWIVEAQQQRLRQPGAFTARVRTGQDWFDLEGGIDYDGEIVPLPELLRAARAGDSFVRLADGTQGVLPPGTADAWATLGQLASEVGGALRFAENQGWLLDALLMSRQDITVDEGFGLHRARLTSFDGIAPQPEPAAFHGTLRGYQREALGWFGFLEEFGWGGCLADDMGLGKTVQVLALLEHRRATEASKVPSIAIVPRSVVFNWVDEAAHFTPELRVLDYTGPGRVEARAVFNEYDLIVTTYGTLRRDAVVLGELAFDYAILDEAQNIKNPSSQAAKAARLLRAKHRLALTGTPVENRLSDLWSLFEFLNPGMLGRSAQFKRVAALSGELGEADGGRALIARALRPFLLRRTKEQVAPELPARTEQVVHCELTPPQRKLYGELRDHYRSVLLAGREGRRESGQTFQVLEALLRLRQAACHTSLVTGDHAAAKPSSGKLDTLMEMLPEATVGGHKALVFSQFTSLLALVRERLDAAGVPYLYLDGATRKRKALVDRFQNESSESVFLISLKAGGTGLNLTAADYVFLLDPWWNPAVEAQAIDRTHRIGQDRSVMAYRLIAENTVEDRVLELQQQKRSLADAIVNEDNALLRNLTREDLSLLLA